MSLAVPAGKPARAARAAAAPPPASEGDAKKKPAISCCGFFAFAVMIVVGFNCYQTQKQALEDLAAGDKLYTAGKKAEAVAKYKSGFAHATDDRKAEIIKRAADFEATAGSQAEARYWVEQGIIDKLEITYDTPAARDVLANVRRERAEAEAKRQAELAKKRTEDEERWKGKQITVEQLRNEYQADATAADGRYKGTNLRITGTLKEYMGIDPLDPKDPEVIVILNQPDAMPQVWCRFSRTRDEQLRGLRVGQRVTIRGRCAGSFLKDEIRITSCDLER